MIDTNKLLSNRSGGTTTLSRKSVINIGLIRDDVKKVDNLLKMKLVMSKVREGIEKENQERLKRKKREDDLESEICNCDDDPDKRDIDPKKPRGLLGSLIGGVLSVLGGIALKFLPTLLKVFSFIKKIAKPLTIVLGGAFAIFKTFLTLFKSTSDELRGIDRNLIKKGTIERVFTDFGNAVLIAASGIGIMISTAVAINFILRKRLMAVDVLVDNLILMRRTAKARTLTDDELIEQAARTLGLNLDDIMTQTPTAKPRGRRATRIPGGVGAKRGSVAGGTISFSGDAAYEKIRRGNVTPKTIEEIINSSSFQKKARKIKSARSKVMVSLGFDTPLEILKGEIKSSLDVAEIAADESKFKARNLPIKEQAIINKNINDSRKIIKKLRKIEDVTQNIGGGGLFKGLGDLKMGPMLTEGFSSSGPLSGINPKKFLSNKQILESTDLLKAPIIKDLNPKLLLTKGGGSILLKQIGGEAFAAAFKQGLKSAVGVIPFIGDLIGILLDIFVFGEPVGRAIFKGIGSFAIAALLGGLGFAVGGPVGAFIGSVAGGIGGDILGGIVYDMFFKSGRGISTKSSSTKGVVKGATSQFRQGGFVGPEPSVQPLVNSVDKSTDLRVMTSYNKTGVGKVKFVPIPLPIPQKEQTQEEQQINMTSDTAETRTFAGLYER